MTKNSIYKSEKKQQQVFIVVWYQDQSGLPGVSIDTELLSTQVLLFIFLINKQSFDSACKQQVTS